MKHVTYRPTIYDHRQAREGAYLFDSALTEGSILNIQQ